jgi:hypothetical protein
VEADNGNLLEDGTHRYKQNTEALIEASKKAGLEVKGNVVHVLN